MAIIKYYKNEEGELKRFTIDVDDNPPDPRLEFENLAHMYIWWNRYSMGDNEGESNPDIVIRDILNTIDPSFDPADKPLNELIVTLQTQYTEQIKILPCFVLEHSGVMVSCAPFSDSWDSGFAGFIYILREEADDAGILWSDARTNILAEIDTYNMYLCGQVYMFDLDDDNGYISGYYSDKSENELIKEIQIEAGLGDARLYDEDEVIVEIIEKISLKPGVD